MSTFVTAADKTRQLSNEYGELKRQAVERINKLIREAKELPIAIPIGLFTEVPCVRYDLLRMLREEGGWEHYTDAPPQSTDVATTVFLKTIWSQKK